MMPTTSPCLISKDTSLRAQMWVALPLGETGCAGAKDPKGGAQGAGQNIPQGEVALTLANAITLAQVFSVNDDVGHGRTVESRESRVESQEPRAASGKLRPASFAGLRLFPCSHKKSRRPRKARGLRYRLCVNTSKSVRSLRGASQSISRTGRRERGSAQAPRIRLGPLKGC